MGSGFKTFTSGPLSSADVNNYLMKQVTATVTSTTRPSAPEAGQRIYETDTKKRLIWDGARWAPDSLTPVLASRNDTNPYATFPGPGLKFLFSAQVDDVPAGPITCITDVVLQADTAAAPCNLRVTYAVGTSGTETILNNDEPPADLTTQRLHYVAMGIIPHPGGQLTVRNYANFGASTAVGRLWTAGSRTLLLTGALG